MSEQALSSKTFDFALDQIDEEGIITKQVMDNACGRHKTMVGAKRVRRFGRSKSTDVSLFIGKSCFCSTENLSIFLEVLS